jgi:murein DD-endopeptidase MepM/ murein hydrolase activator NlpD
MSSDKSRLRRNLILLLGAAGVYGHLFYQSAFRNPPPRVGLLNANKPQDPQAALAAGLVLIPPLELARTPVASRLSYPLGSENGALTYNARPFGEVDHLGDDLNGIGGENSDLGDPVFAIGNGLVVYAAPASEGWGNVVILQHRLSDGHFFQSFYGHLDSVQASPGQQVYRSQVIGTVGSAGGKYLAHLHFEIRDSISLGAGVGYHRLRLDRKNPEEFLREHRNAAETDFLPALETIAGPLPPENGMPPGKEWKGAREPRQ